MATSCCSNPPDSSPAREQRLELIVGLLFVTTVLLIFLLIAGLGRRRHRSFLLGPFTVLVYSLSSGLMIYTLALMRNAPFRHEMFPLWATYLVMVQVGSVDTFSSLSLENNERWRSFYMKTQIQCFQIGSLMGLDGSKALSLFFVSLCIYLLLSFKFMERVASMGSASKSTLQAKFKVIADHMSTEHPSSDLQLHDADPVSMRGYKYVVRGEEARQISKEAEAPSYTRPLSVSDRELITIEKVWDCKGWLLNSRGGDPHGYLKDICLSFSLFKLLILKYAGYSMPRLAYQKTWHLIRHVLLSSSDGNGHERVFRVIELELAFLFDLFYTKYQIILRPGYWKWKLFQFLLMLGVSIATPLLVFSKSTQVEHQDSVLPKQILIVITAIVMLIYVVVEIIQLWLAYTSEWAQVMLLCDYVKKENWRGKRYFEKLLKAICSFRFFQWDRKLGQYSLIECFAHRPSKIIFNRNTQFLYDRKRDGQKEIASTRLAEPVKKEVMRSLTTNGSGYLTNGLSSLRRNGVLDQLSWACHLETQTHVIIVWHIATFFCEHEVPCPRQQRANFDTATTLSKYLAYLVTFVPRMLPDHSYVTQQVFDQVIIEAKIFFKECEGLEKRIHKLRCGGQTDQTVLGRAVTLGQQLVNEITDPESNNVKDGGFIWRILAEFWAELALYVAPSDDVEVHLKHLALGGEFVTHLWALLYHAGIKRVATPSGEP